MCRLLSVVGSRPRGQLLSSRNPLQQKHYYAMHATPSCRSPECDAAASWAPIRVSVAPLPVNIHQHTHTRAHWMRHAAQGVRGGLRGGPRDAPGGGLGAAHDQAAARRGRGRAPAHARLGFGLAGGGALAAGGRVPHPGTVRTQRGPRPQRGYVCMGGTFACVCAARLCLLQASRGGGGLTAATHNLQSPPLLTHGRCCTAVRADGLFHHG